MLSFFSIFWELFINIIETIIYFYYINSILSPKKMKHRSLHILVFLVLRVGIVSIFNVLGVTPVYCILFLCIFSTIFSIKLYKQKKFICFIWNIVHSILGVIAELISYALLDIFTSMLPHQIMVGESFRFPCTTLYIICVAALCFFVSSLNIRTPIFTRSQKIFAFFTMAVGLLITHCFMYILVNLNTSTPTLIDIIILANFVFLAFFIFLLVYIYQLAYTQQENKELQERAQLLELEENQYNNLLSTTESLREIKHDIHHHLSTIHSFIQNDESERLRSYLKEYQTHFESDYTIASTGNIVIDSILSTKMYAAKQQNTPLNFTVHLPDEFPFSDVTLSALLGNLFDNALEACSHVPDEQKRWINFHMKTQENMLVIHIDNSFDGIVKKTVTQGFLSRKEEPNHGIGLKRVSTLVEEADGFIEIAYNDQCFTVQIMVPLEDRNEA